MTNRKTTKRALISSLLALLVCCTMLIGTTFAWFTDGEFIKGNVIKAGTLDIELGSDTKLFSVSELWEPGYSEAAATTLKNVGTLALKYSFSIANLQYEGEANIAEVLDVYAGVYTGEVDANGSSVIDGTLLGTLAELNEMDNFGITDDGVLLPGEETPVKLVIKMQESAGNEYQAAQCSFDINILATQVPYEVDGNNNPNYDQEATFGAAVATEADLAAALGAGKNVTVTADIAIDETITVTGDVTIELQADLDASATAGRPFDMEDGSTLTINANGYDVKVGTYGLVNIAGAADVTINGGNFTGNVDNGAMIKVRDTATDVNITLNNVTYTAADSFVINMNGFDGTAKINVYGGTYTCKAGIQAVNADVVVKDATFNTTGIAFEIAESDALIDNCTITVDPGVVVGTAPATCVAATNNGYAKVINSTLTGKNAATAYAVFTTGGDIEAANNVVNAEGG
ncbi:MAG: hypothetical protein IKT68_01200 [Clostridia bacterium]|nr:hypothetical protein [Clostridia bacterium]